MSVIASDIEHELIRLALEAQRAVGDTGDRYRAQWVRRLREQAEFLSRVADALEADGNAIPIIEPRVEGRRHAA